MAGGEVAMTYFTDRVAAMAYLAQLGFSEQTADHLLDRAVIYSRPVQLVLPGDDSIVTEITWHAGRWHISKKP
jgi:hypothetical protein